MNQISPESEISATQRTYLLHIMCSKNPEATARIKEIMSPYRSFDGSNDRYTFSWTVNNVTWLELITLREKLLSSAGNNLITLRINPL